jgi:xanthine dehydrogenase accessory factor
MSDLPRENGLPRDWLPTLVRFLEREPLVVRIVVAEVRGSTPREPGAFMLVGRDGVEGSIGGGQLEWEAIAGARELLEDAAVAARVNKVVLGADVGQCCGGVVSLWLERFTRESLELLEKAGDAGARGCAVLSSTIRGAGVEHTVARRAGAGAAAMVSATAGDSAAAGVMAALVTADAVADARGGAVAGADAGLAEATERLFREPRQRAHSILTHNAAGELTFIERLDDEFPAVWLYGAGHVGQALARILAELPLRLTWIDSRAELFPETLGGGVRVIHDADSVATVSEAPVGAYFIVMSHSHPLDFALCHALLERNDFAWLGLIGSASKAARFRSRLRRAGLGPDVIGKLVCPIGVDGIESKWPAAIAVAVAAQLMQQISAVGVEQPDVLIRRRELVRTRTEPPRTESERVESPLGERARAEIDRDPLSRGELAQADPACAPENCATCGSAAGRPGTVSS